VRPRREMVPCQMTDLEVRHPETCRGECAHPRRRDERPGVPRCRGRSRGAAPAPRRMAVGRCVRIPGAVTVLLADARASIDLAEQVDPEDRRPIRDRLFAILAFMLVSWTSNYRETMTRSGAVESLLREMKRRPALDSADGRAERPATPRYPLDLARRRRALRGGTPASCTRALAPSSSTCGVQRRR
jgi:hypothetical protein